MKEILFRGKRIDGKGWVYGNLVHYKSKPFIVGNLIEANDEYTVLNFWYPVIPETVGQFITTINGYKVFDGDIFTIKPYEYFVKIESDFQAVCYHLKTLYGGKPLKWGPLYRINELVWEDDFHLIGNIHEYGIV